MNCPAATNASRVHGPAQEVCRSSVGTEGVWSAILVLPDAGRAIGAPMDSAYPSWTRAAMTLDVIKSRLRPVQARHASAAIRPTSAWAPSAAAGSRGHLAAGRGDDGAAIRRPRDADRVILQRFDHPRRGIQVTACTDGDKRWHRPLLRFATGGA